MRLHADRSGFALPMTILLIGFMTAGVLAGFARSSTELQIADDERLTTAAYATAERGLSSFLAVGSVSTTSVLYNFGGGDSARVTATLMHNAPGNEPDTWLVRSTGYARGAPGKPVARRTVAQLAHRIPTTMQVLSSWTSLSGLNKAGAAGDISGYDACSGAAVAGVATPTGGLTGKDESISGTPQNLEMGTAQEMASQIKIDWEGITDPVAPAISPDYTVCLSATNGYNNQWPNCASWPSQPVFNSGWPTIVINGSSPLPSNGRGVLIVTGDLTFGGGDTWDGIILVGGRIVDNGSGNIAGAVVSGLNVLKNWPVGESSKANGTKDYTYDSCKVASATSSLARLQQLSNAWVDTWTW